MKVCTKARMKAQVALEYMMIIFIILLFVVPIWAYMNDVSNRAGTQLAVSYAQSAVNKIANDAGFIYSQGPPARLVTKLYIPRGVQNYSIAGNTISLSMLLEGQYGDVTATSQAQLNGTLPVIEGEHWITIESAGGSLVNISGS